MKKFRVIIMIVGLQMEFDLFINEKPVVDDI
jgi:hypothetical protein